MAKKKGKIARQSDLPGMEDRRIAGLENAAQDYAEIRDQRQALSQKEVELKGNLLTLMHKLDKTEYHRGNVSISIIVEKEKVKVRIKSASTETETEDEEIEEEAS